MNTKKQARIKRSRRGRAKVRFLEMPRLTVHRTPQHIYAQVVTYQGVDSKVLAHASTLDEKIKKQLSGPKTDEAKVVGKEIAERAIKAGVKKVAFDRSGFKYHGRVKALADAAREAGLIF